MPLFVIDMLLGAAVGYVNTADDPVGLPNPIPDEAIGLPNPTPEGPVGLPKLEELDDLWCPKPNVDVPVSFSSSDSSAERKFH